MDLIILVADSHQEKTIETLLNERYHSLRIRKPTFQINRHPRKDAGVYVEAAAFFSVRRNQCDRALVVLDQEWEGSPTAVEIKQKIEQDFQNDGWSRDRFEVIVINPELEIWVWGQSPVVPEVLRTTWEAIREIALRYEYWPNENLKPSRPKELLEKVLQSQRPKRPVSSAIFQELAQKVSVTRCQDESFNLLMATLQNWFPLYPAQE